MEYVKLLKGFTAFQRRGYCRVIKGWVVAQRLEGRDAWVEVWAGTDLRKAGRLSGKVPPKGG